MPLTYEQFNRKVLDLSTDISHALSCFHEQSWSGEITAAEPDSDRLRAVIDATVDLRAPDAVEGDTLAVFSVIYKLCTDSFGAHLAVEHSSFVLKAKLDRTPIIRWDYDREARSKPSSHVQMTAHRGALSHLLSRLEHATPHSIESLHMPMGGDRFRPCLEDIVEFLIRDCGFKGGADWRDTLRSGRAKWRRIQTRAVVRDAPAEAAAQLMAMGYTVTAPDAGHGPERTERLTGW